jgi:site-specific recombinase XerC
MSFNCGQP